MAGLDTEVGRKSAKADTAESDESNPRELLCSRSILVDSSSGGNDHSNRKGSNVSLSAGRGKSASSSNKRSERPELLDGSPSESDGPSTRMAAHADKPASNPAEIFQSEDNKADPEESDDAGSARVDKKEKQGLRKGKWAVEEEEYTSRVIQHFSAGLLTLPDGATLRSYLADKLNCDPMRITKKFTGACCLGRRVYHLRDRPRPTSAEVEMAKAERDHLEQRFRLRIEHEHSGLPLSRRRELILAQPQTNVNALYPMHNFSPGNTLSPWLPNTATAGYTGASAVPAPVSFPGSQNFLASGTSHLSSANLHQNPSRWLPGNATESITNNSAQNDQWIQLLNNLLTSWTLAQAAASLPPDTLASFVSAAGPGSAIQGLNSRPSNLSKTVQGLKSGTSNPSAVSTPVADRASSQQKFGLQQQLRNAYEEQAKEEEQRQLRAAFEEEKRKGKEREKAAAGTEVGALAQHAKMRVSEPAKTVSSFPSKNISPAEQLQKSYEAHLQTLKDGEVASESSRTRKAKSSSHVEHKANHNASHDYPRKGEDKNQQPMPDEEAGTVLLGFLNSLRQSYEDAVDEKTDKSSASKHLMKKQSHGREGWTEEFSPAIVEEDGKIKKGGAKRSQSKMSISKGSQSEGYKRLATPAGFMNASAGRRSQRPASVTDTSSGNSSSQQAEFSSSLDDSSDKTDPSSSEESDKEIPAREKRRHSRGPPRKRLKSLIRENWLAHNKSANENIDD